MLRGKLSEMQRDAAWEGKSLTERERMTAHNLNLGGEESARAAGVRVTAAGQAREAEYLERKRSEDRFRDAVQRAQMSERAQAAHRALGDYGDRLRDEQRRIERRMAELRDREEARDAIGELIASRSLDRENPEHLALLGRAGLDPNQSDEELQENMERDAQREGQEHDALAERLTEIERQLPLVDEARLRIERGEDPEAVLRDLAGRGIHIESESNDREAVAARMETYGQDLNDERTQISERVEVDSGTSVSASPEAIEIEVEAFMRDLAANQSLMMSGDILRDAMQTQIENLSDDARELLEATDETAFLFERAEPEPTSERADLPEQTSAPIMGPGSNL